MLLMAKPCSPLFLSLTLCSMLSMYASFAIAFNSIATDQSTLVALKNHLFTTNPQNLLSKNWSTTTSICNWIGVTCSSRHHRVTALNISNMGLSATLPSQLGNLSFLVSLDVSNNFLHGNLPDELSRLHRLKDINLRNNSLTGPIPPSLFNLSKLESMALAYNLLQGSIPPQIGNLTNLKVFGAKDNRFTGTLPTGIGNLKMLQFLLLSLNSFQGAYSTYTYLYISEKMYTSCCICHDLFL